MKRKTTLFFLFFSFIFFSATAQTNISGGQVSGTWTSAGSPYKINGDLEIKKNKTLQIEPGVTVEFQGHYSLEVEGRLLALGSASQRIVFTASNATTGWKGIRFDGTRSSDSSKIDYCIIKNGKATTGNSEDKQGGAVFVKSFSKLRISNSLITNNISSYYGGAISCRYGASPLIINNVICNNSSSSVGGAIYMFSSSNPQLINNTIVNNSSVSNGGGVYVNGTYPVIKNCILWGNEDGSSYGNYDQVYPSGKSYVTYCDVEDGYSGGTSNISGNPKFVSPSSGAGNNYNGALANWSLQSSSASIDQASNSVLGILPDYDMNGKVRLDGNGLDIGAAEYISSFEACGVINSNTLWSGSVLINCDVTVNSGKTLTIAPGTRIISTGHYKIDIKGRLLAIGNVDSFITFSAYKANTGWAGIRFYNTSSSNDTSKIEFCTFQDGKANGSGLDGYGGAIFVYNFSKLIIRNSKFSNNYAINYGGAICTYSNASPKIISSLFVNNEARYGGAIANISAGVILTNNTIANNKATYYGGGLYRSSGSPVVRNSIFYGNTANSGSQIYPGSGLNVTYSCVQGSYSGSGNINSDPMFKSPTAGSGNAYFGLNANWALKMNSNCIDNGSSSVSGLELPAIDMASKPRIHNSVVDIGAYEDISFVNVCGWVTSDTTWNASIIRVNCDIEIKHGNKLTIAPGTRVEFNGHYRINVEGSIQALGTATDSIVFAINPSYITTGWKGILIDNPSNSNDSSIFNYCIIENVKAVSNTYSDYGAAITVRYFDKLRISNSFIRNNTHTGTYGRGAGLYDYYSDIVLKNTLFENNTAYMGGAMYLYRANLQMINNLIRDNRSEYYGGAMYILYSAGSFHNNKIVNNRADRYGAAMYYTGLEASTFSNNLIANNYAHYYGGAIYISNDAKPYFYNNVICNNKSRLSGGGFYLSSNADPIIKNCIIRGNEDNSAKNQFCLIDVSSDPKIYNSNIEGGINAFTGTGAGNNYNGVYQDNIDTTAMFQAPTANAGYYYSGDSADWNIKVNSPCINTGSPDTIGMNVYPVDLAANPRIYNGRIDMGAYENQDDIYVCGDITKNTIWDADTIKVNCDVVVKDGVTLSISAGTCVQFQGYHSITVQGRLIALGNPNEHIYFTIKDTTDFSNLDSLKGGWNRIVFYNTSNSNDSSVFRYCDFQYGKATYAGSSSYSNARGGAIYVYNYSKVEISNCIFSNNLAGVQGGALFCESSDIIIKNNLFVNNLCKGYLTYAKGGAIYLDDCNISLTSNTFANNLADRYGGAVYLWSSTINMRNCVFYGNRSTTNQYYGHQIYAYGCNLTISNSLIEDGQSNIRGSYNNFNLYNNNLDTDPLFNNPSAGTGIAYNGLLSNFSINPESPCINRGHTTTSSLPSVDLAGNQRIIADTVDIGAYEVQLSPNFITQQPGNQTKCIGTLASFSVNASINVNYQWQRNGFSIPGANSRILIISPVSIADTGQYSCILSNQMGSINSDTVSLNVRVAPTILSSPGSRSICENQSTTFNVSASGSAPLTYQWYSTNGMLPGATNASYTINSVGQNNASNYYCIVTNNCGFNQSNGATLNVNTSPSISQIPASVTLCEDNSTIYSVNTTGTTPIGYQWYHDNNNVNGANTGTFSITNADVNDAGNYYCKATNLCGSVNSNTSAVTIDEKPEITAQSVNTTRCSGQSMTFSVTATGTQPLSYQWYDNNGLISGATNNTYTINSVTTSDAGNYYCIVTNHCGTKQGNSIALSVNEAPTITAQSTSESRCNGNSQTFSITASGTAPLTYQWYFENSAITNATNNTYTINSVDTSDQGSYYCLVSNSCGSATSTQKYLTINTEPIIDYVTSNSARCEGQNMTFSVNANGTSPFSYQWKKNSSNISNATNNTYVISSVSTSDAASYQCVVSNICGSTSSNTSALTVKTAPQISAQTSNATRCSGQNQTFSVTATGTAPLSYQWYNDQGDISSATNNTYTLNTIDTGDAGNYYCIVSNQCGNIQSTTKTLAVNEAPTINYITASASRCEYQNMTFSVSATGTNPISYQWKKNSSNISNATNNTYVISSVSTSDAASYQCVVSNVCGTTNSNSSNLTVKTAPQISAQSYSATKCSGQSQTFSVTATGSAPLSYQWYNDQGSISSATNNTYSLNAVDTGDASNYYCIISNQCGNIQSTNKTLTVNMAPSISFITAPATICEYQNMTFNVAASGTSPISYQWYKNSSAISGASNNLYSINSAGTGDAGTYYCTASNICGNSQSNNTSLSIKTAPNITAQSSGGVKCSGQSQTFSVTATGSAPLSYQWYNDQGSISSATNNTYSLNAVDTGDAGNYYCIISNQCGNIQSTNKTLTVNVAPSISFITAPASICEYQSMTFNVTASGTSPISYQWYKNSSAISGASNNLYSINSVGTGDAGTYYCSASNACGNSQSNNTSLSIKTAPNITAQSSGAVKCWGQSQSFSITAGGTSPISYQWYNDLGSISNATNNIYNISSVDTNDIGNYYCIASNQCGQVQSSGKNLDVKIAPGIATQSQNNSLCEGQSLSFNVTPEGSTPFTYQWYKGGNPINNANNNIYSINAVNSGDAGSFYCKISNYCGTIQSTNMSLNVNTSPQITSQATGGSACTGNSFNFSLSSTGSTPMQYQWYHNNQIINGATNNSYTINSVDSGDVGDYYCKLSNMCGTINSLNNNLNVMTAPGILSFSDTTEVCLGNDAIIAIAASGTSPLDYQWYHNMQPLNGSVNNFHIINSAVSTDGGNYYCLAKNACGTVIVL